MNKLNGEETLWVILPILLVVGVLVVSIIILPQTQIKTTSKASQPTAIPTKVIVPSIPDRPEIVCSSLYSPVCSQNGVTYPSECEANQAGVTSFTKGICPKTAITPKILPISN